MQMLMMAPNGTPITNETFEVRGPADMAALQANKRELALRYTGAPGEADSFVYDFGPGAKVSAGGEVLKDGRRITGGVPLRVAWP